MPAVPGLQTTKKLKLAMYVSLDGVVQDPSWTGPFWNDQLSDLQAEYLYSSDALVLGRVTYEGFAAAWPGMEEATADFGRTMNSMPKHVGRRDGEPPPRRREDDRHRRRGLDLHLRVAVAAADPPVEDRPRVEEARRDHQHERADDRA
jgi:hypothetical protein